MLRVESDPPYLFHPEFQSSREVRMDERILRYNVLAGYEHRLPVLSVVFLLRKSADKPHLSGRLQKADSLGRPYLDFHYRVMRLWEQPVENVLTGPPGLLPLAPLTDVLPGDLPEIVQRMERRLQNEVSPSEANELWTGTFVLMGLRYPPA